MSSDTYTRGDESGDGDGDKAATEMEMDLATLIETCSEVGDILRSPRRLRVIDVLAEEQKIERGDLAREVARREAGADELPEVSGTEYQRAYIGIIQSHLPKLKDHEIIEWDETDRNHLVPGPEFGRYLSAYHAVALSQGLPVEGDLGGVDSE